MVLYMYILYVSQYKFEQGNGDLWLVYFSINQENNSSMGIPLIYESWLSLVLYFVWNS